jgi:hypothetical protein
VCLVCEENILNVEQKENEWGKNTRTIVSEDRDF